MSPARTTTTVDITPTSLGLLPGLLAIIGNVKTPADFEAAKTAREELRRMAGLADAHVATIRNGRAIEKELKSIAATLDAASSSPAVRAASARIRAIAERV